eukprot:1956726-Pyramimonas_sp.AAC.2
MATVFPILGSSPAAASTFPAVDGAPDQMARSLMGSAASSPFVYFVRRSDLQVVGLDRSPDVSWVWLHGSWCSAAACPAAPPEAARRAALAVLPGGSGGLPSEPERPREPPSSSAAGF